MKYISEKDLYKYTFYPLTLEKDKRDYIENNISKFKDELAILRNIKESVENKISDDILNRIYDKIKTQYKPDEIILFYVKSNKKKNNLVISADSVNTDSTNGLDTYSDYTNKFLAKVISKDEQSSIYIFSKIKSALLNFEITLFPSNDMYSTNSESLPLIISPRQVISRIHLKLKANPK